MIYHYTLCSWARHTPQYRGRYVCVQMEIYVRLLQVCGDEVSRSIARVAQLQSVKLITRESRIIDNLTG